MPLAFRREGLEAPRVIRAVWTMPTDDRLQNADDHVGHRIAGGDAKHGVGRPAVVGDSRDEVGDGQPGDDVPAGSGKVAGIGQRAREAGVAVEPERPGALVEKRRGGDRSARRHPEPCSLGLKSRLRARARSEK